MQKRIDQDLTGIEIQVLTMPQKPGLYIPTPPAGHALVPWLSQSTSIRRATVFRSKHDDRSVDKIRDDSLPMIDQGSMFEGVLWPPASKPGNPTYNQDFNVWLI